MTNAETVNSTTTTQLDETEVVWASLFTAVKALERARELELAQCGMSLIQAMVIYAVVMAKEPMTPTQLARLVNREPNSMSSLLTRMEKQGLVKKTRNPKKRAQVMVSLTPKGQEAFQRQMQAREVHNLVSHLSNEDRAGLLVSVQKLHSGAIEIIKRMRPTPYG